MKTIESIDTAALETVTGGIFSPCPAILSKKLGEASQRDLAMAKAQCGVKMPTRKQINDASHIRF